MKFDYTNNVSATNFVSVDLTPVTNILNDPNNGLSAINSNVLSTSAIVKDIQDNGIAVDLTTVVSGLNYIISQIDNSNYGLSAINDNVNYIPESVQNIMIDGVPFTEAFSNILSWAIGKIEYNGYGKFVYYKQDNITSAFGLSATDTNRMRF